ncbi:MAG: carboxylating nicotinate-nucleotide diphosphorylase [Candidatus Lambdaproteobacteria bacterium]|nr:carboxylating nicotinate-nucleotide diphosphorylase [Candidatus Lambdaproteobacteria bacterium]
MLNEAHVEAMARQALAEDLGWGDLTSETFCPPGRPARMTVRFKQEGVLCGLPLARAVFRQAAPDMRWTPLAAEGVRMAAGQPAAAIEGEARMLLQGERVALNFLQRLSGVATLTAAFVARARQGSPTVRITDTRKTTPGLRTLEKYAVRIGGGVNHRYGLADGVLVKDNHLALLERAGVSLAEAVARARRALPHTCRIEIEVESLAQARQALEAGADALLLDNMSEAAMREAVGMVGGRALLEASGNMTLERVAAVAATGVDLISVGALTHSAPAVDISLDFEA